MPAPVVIALVLAVPAFILYRWLQRRAAFRAFATTRGLRFRGTIPSDKYPPYALFPRVSNAVLLHHVVEGTLGGLEVAAFDFPRRGGSRTAVIVSGLPVEASRQLAAEDDTSFAIVDGHLLGCRLQQPIAEIPAFVESVIERARRL